MIPDVAESDLIPVVINIHLYKDRIPDKHLKRYAYVSCFRKNKAGRCNRRCGQSASTCIYSWTDGILTDKR